MAAPVSAQEALVAELLGEVDGLLRRMEKLRPELLQAERALAQRAADIGATLDRYEAGVNLLTEHAQRSAIHHIVTQTNELAQSTLARQVEALQAAARSAWGSEAANQLDRLVERLSTSLPRRQWPWHRPGAAAALALLVFSMGLAAGMAAHRMFG